MELPLRVAVTGVYPQALCDGGRDDEVASSTTEREDKTLTDENTIEQVVFGIAAYCAMEKVKQWRGHEDGQGRAEDLWQRDAAYGYAQDEHKGSGDNASSQSCHETDTKALFPCQMHSSAFYKMAR